ncbi:putative T7SS-secreted protein [Streptomyces sp. enrichment culture]|uniref:putative T7SS-secreted protein n=1 Tax=Streptomyces sp. enrichment culture TaxID=1795815 RepID=UPI003F556F4B
MSRIDADWPPLWHDDPTPGDPEEVAELGRKLRKMANMIDEQSRVIDALASVEGWDSEAGKGFHELAGGTADKLKKSFERYDEAAKAIGEDVSEGTSDRFASEMRRAQRKADKALSDYRAAEGEHDLADREVKKITDKHPLGDIPTAEKEEHDRWVKKRADALHDIGSARKAVKDARDIYDDAGDKAARHIKNIVHHDSVRDPGGFMNFLADWADMLSNISAVLSVLAVICAFVPPLQFLVPIFAALAVLTSAAALAGHAYDMSVRGGKVDWLKLGADTLGVLPGLGALKGIRAFTGLKGMAKLKAFGKLKTWGSFNGLAAVDGIGHNFLNGISVSLVNKVLGRTARNELIDGKKITAVIKGTGLASALNRMLSGENGEKTGYQESAPAGPTPSPSPGPAPSVSPTAFKAALAA